MKFNMPVDKNKYFNTDIGCITDTIRGEQRVSGGTSPGTFLLYHTTKKNYYQQKTLFGERKRTLPMTFESADLSDANFQQLSRIAYDTAGIKLTAEKKEMAKGRLLRRLHDLNYESFDEYFAFLSTEAGKNFELPKMINELTTNKTEFFREGKHFQILLNEALPEFIRNGGIKDGCLRIWSAGCSTGEEVYSIAVQIHDYCMQNSYNYNVLGTDISTDVLQKAQTAVYPLEETGGISDAIIRKFFMKSRDPEKSQVRVSPEIRSHAEFRYHNLVLSEPPVMEAMDAIFCRNVIIYFDRQTQIAVLNKLISCLKPGGYFFHGHSESLLGIDLPLERIQATVYRRKRNAK